MSRAGILGHEGVPGFPRVSGDEPLLGTRRWSVTEFSPRERG